MSRELVERLREPCRDYTGEMIVRDSTPRYEIHCDILYEAADEIERLNGIIEAAKEWADARLSFIALGVNDPSSRQALNRLSDAENALCILSKAHKVKE